MLVELLNFCETSVEACPISIFYRKRSLVVMDIVCNVVPKENSESWSYKNLQKVIAGFDSTCRFSFTEANYSSQVFIRSKLWPPKNRPAIF